VRGPRIVHEEETAFLLRGDRSGPLKARVERKLKRAGWT
jgi:hypothetical protein